MSIIWLAARIAFSSCFIIITVLSRSRRWISVFNRRSLLRWCRSIDGSFSTYITLIRFVLIWFVRRIRCVLSLESVFVERESVR